MNNNSKIVIAALGGAIIGAGIALLFAPASGKETRENIADSIEDAKDKVKDSLSSLKHKAEEMMARGKDGVENMKENIKDLKA